MDEQNHINSLERYVMCIYFHMFKYLYIPVLFTCIYMDSTAPFQDFNKVSKL